MTTGRFFRDLILAGAFMLVIGSVATAIEIVKLPLRLVR